MNTEEKVRQILRDIKTALEGTLTVTGGGGGTQYEVDTAAGATDTGTLALVVRDDTLSTLTPADGDYTQLRTNNQGALWVKPSGTVAVSGTFWQATQPISAASLPLPSGAATSAKQLADGHNVTVDNVGGVEVVQNTAADLNVTEASASAIKTAVELIDDIVLAEDAAHGSGDKGVMALAVRDDTISADAADGDYVPLKVDYENRLYVISKTVGDIAHDAADGSANPLKIGGRAQEPTTALEEVADNDRVDAAFDRQGRLATWMGYPVLSADINDATSGNNTIVAAGGAGKRIAVLGCVIVSDGTVDVRWEDGAGGTAKTGQIPLQEREGFVMPIGPQPWFVGTANTLLNLELSAAVNVHGIVSYVLMED